MTYINWKKLSAVKTAMMVFATFAFCIACGNNGDGASKADLGTGKKVYKTYCVACHGIDGKLNLNGAKDFTTSTLAFAERKNIITNGKGLMTPFKEVLSAEEIEAVAAYTLELSKGEQ